MVIRPGDDGTYHYIERELKSSKDVAVEYFILCQERKYKGRKWRFDTIKLVANNREQAVRRFNEAKSGLVSKYWRALKLFEKRSELIFLTE